MIPEQFVSIQEHCTVINKPAEVRFLFPVIDPVRFFLRTDPHQLLSLGKAILFNQARMSTSGCSCPFCPLPVEILEQIATELVATKYFDEVVSLSRVCARWRSFLSAFRLAPGSSLLSEPEPPEDLVDGSAQEEDVGALLPSSPSFYQLMLLRLELDQEDWKEPQRGYFTCDFPDPIPLPTPGHLCQWQFLQDPVLDSRALLLSYLVQEDRLLRSVAALFNLPDDGASSSAHQPTPRRTSSGRRVFEWQAATGIVLPRVLRKLYSLVDGGLFDGGDIEFFSLDQITASRGPLAAVACDLDAYVLKQLVSSLSEDELLSTTQTYSALTLADKLSFAERHQLRLKNIGLPSYSVDRLIELAQHPTQCQFVVPYLQFALAPRGIGSDSDVRIRYFFNALTNRMPLRWSRMVDSSGYDLVASAHHLSVLWDHEDPSGNGGWWNKSFAKLPESLTTWMLVLLQGLGCTLGAYDQP